VSALLAACSTRAGKREIGERVRLVIDALEGASIMSTGRLPRRELAGYDRAAGSAPSGPRAADRNIMDIATRRALIVVRASGTGTRRHRPHRRRPRGIRRSHVRDWSAAAEAGQVERIDADQWLVPPDLPERGHAYDSLADGANVRLSILSPPASRADRR